MPCHLPRVRGGMKNEPLIPPTSEADTGDLKGGEDAEDAPRAPVTPPPSTAKPNVRVETGHTGEQVLVAAKGPGSARVHGFIDNTDVFRIIMTAYGWDK